MNETSTYGRSGVSGEAIYCHCYPVFRCEPAVAEAEGPDIWRPVCERCQQIAFDAGIRVRSLLGYGQDGRLMSQSKRWLTKAICSGCGRRSAPRVTGTAPDGWRKFVDRVQGAVTYRCPNCSP